MKPVQDQLCLEPHYATVVETQKAVEIYQLGDVDCVSCLRRMVEKHEDLAKMFRARLATLSAAFQPCRAYDAACINPHYCDSREACCAGDPNCRAAVP